MRKRHSFLLTLLPAEDNLSSIQGKLKTIATGRTSSFSNLDELYELLKDELTGNLIINRDIHSFFSLMPPSSDQSIPE